ncbi:hypothetical protein D3C79_980240 [compost metagenome]
MPAAQGQAQAAHLIEPHVVVQFVLFHIMVEVALVVFGVPEALRRHVRQAEQPGGRLLAVGDVERVK